MSTGKKPIRVNIYITEGDGPLYDELANLGVEQRCKAIRRLAYAGSLMESGRLEGTRKPIVPPHSSLQSQPPAGTEPAPLGTELHNSPGGGSIAADTASPAPVAKEVAQGKPRYSEQLESLSDIGIELV